MDASEHLDATFIALADPTRRAILARLMDGEASVNELAAPFSISQPAISKHLKILERAGLISTSQSATRRPRKSKPPRWPRPRAGSKSTATFGSTISSGSTAFWPSCKPRLQQRKAKEREN